MRYDNIPELMGAAKVRVGGFGHSVPDLRRLILGVVSEIDRLCRKHGIEYFLFGDALRGAVAFRGFLPWDFASSVRLLMTRDRYRKFKEVCARELDPRYLLTDYAEDGAYRILEAQVSVRNTTAATRWRGGNAGVRVDIIVADYLSDAPALRARQMKALSALHRAVCPWDPQPATPRRRLDDALLSAAMFLFGRGAVVRRLENILSSAGSDNSSSLLPACNYPDIALGTSFDKKHFESSLSVAFEDLRLPSPANPLTLLCRIGGAGAASPDSAQEDRYPDENAAVSERALHRYSPALFKEPPKSVEPAIFPLFHPKMGLNDLEERAAVRKTEKRLLKLAAKARRCNEQRQKHLDTMNRNAKIVRSRCNAVIVNDTLTENRSAIDKAVLDRNYKYLCGICEILNGCGIAALEGVDPVLPRCADLFFRIGDIFTADALLKRAKRRGIGADDSESRAFSRKIADFLDAYYAVYENRDSDVSLALNAYANECSALVGLFRGILAFRADDFAAARKFLSESVDRNENLFLGHYYLGLCHKRSGETRNALSAFADALESTLFLPDLALAMEQIESLSQFLQKSTGGDE